MTLYNAEILPDKGISISQFVNWGLTVVVSLLTERGFHALGQIYMFSLFGGINIIGIIFSVFIMKETKDVSKERLLNLYNPAYIAMHLQVDEPSDDTINSSREHNYVEEQESSSIHNQLFIGDNSSLGVQAAG